MTTYEEIKKQSNIYALMKYGHVVTIDEIECNNDKYIANMMVEYPLYIRDDRNKDKYIEKVVNVHDIGHLVYTSDGKLLNSPERKICESLVKDRLTFWRDQLEKIVISTTSYHIAKITRFSNFWNPINFIISSLLSNIFVSKIDYIKSQPSNIAKYLLLLEDLNIITYEDGDYKFSPPIMLKYKDLNSEDEFKNWIISLIIEKRYKTIRDVFNIKQFMPIIQTENVYYIQSLNADELLYKTLHSLTKYYIDWYSDVSWLDVQYWLNDLVSVGVIKFEDEYYFGDEKIFKKMMQKKEELPERIPPLITI